MAFNEDKTRITHLDQGVDFLGFEIRRYGSRGQGQSSRPEVLIPETLKYHRPPSRALVYTSELTARRLEWQQQAT